MNKAYMKNIIPLAVAQGKTFIIFIL